MDLQDEIKIQPEMKVTRIASHQLNPFEKPFQKNFKNNLGEGLLGEGTPNFLNDRFETRFAKLKKPNNQLSEKL